MLYFIDKNAYHAGMELVIRYGLFSLCGVTLATCFAVAAATEHGRSGADQGSTVPPAKSNVIDVLARQYVFEPSRIMVDENTPMMLRVRSADVQHTFTIDELSIDVTVPAKDTTFVDLTGRPSGYIHVLLRRSRTSGAGNGGHAHREP